MERRCSCCGTRYGGFTKTKKHGILCNDCVYIQAHVARHCKYAKNLGQIGDLTFPQWIETLKFYKNNCAYCGVKSTLLEHFIPLCLGGNTTANNCVPACMKCNSRKGNKHPDQVTLIPRIDLDRVKRYLQTR